MDKIEQTWGDNYNKWNPSGKNDGTVEIINTRLFMINKNSSYRYYEEHFAGAKAVVAFEIYSDYYGAAPYYANIGHYCSVLIMEDGSIEELSIRDIGMQHYDYDVKDLFSECDNFGSAFNQTFHFK